MTYGSQKILSEVNFWKSKYITGSQKLFPEVDFRKSKNIPRSQLPKVKKHSPTFVSQKTNFILNIFNSF